MKTLDELKQHFSRIIAGLSSDISKLVREENTLNDELANLYEIKKEKYKVVLDLHGKRNAYEKDENSFTSLICNMFFSYIIVPALVAFILVTFLPDLATTGTILKIVGITFLAYTPLLPSYIKKYRELKKRLENEIHEEDIIQASREFEEVVHFIHLKERELVHNANLQKSKKYYLSKIWVYYELFQNAASFDKSDVHFKEISLPSDYGEVIYGDIRRKVLSRTKNNSSK